MPPVCENCILIFELAAKNLVYIAFVIDAKNVEEFFPGVCDLRIKFSEGDSGLDNRSLDNVSPAPSATFSEDASAANESACSSSQSEASNTESDAKSEQEVCY